MNPALVEKRAVAAPQIDQPKFADILNIDDRVTPRNFW